MAAYRAANPEKMRDNSLRKFGITSADYDDLLDSQDGRCAICRCTACTSGKRFAVDHDHATGVVRGLLCMHCNRGLGCFGDNRETILSAAAYLAR